MKLFAVYLIFILASLTQATELTPNEIFEYADTFKCNDKFPHHSFCKAVEFKPWTEEERMVFENILTELDRPELQHFYKSIKNKGITKFHRVSYAASWYPNHRLRRTQFSRKQEKVLLWVDPVTKVIGVMDQFFTSTEFMDPYAKVSRKTLNILHELAHVYDVANDHISSKSNISKLAGWYWDGKRHAINGLDYDEVLTHFNKILGHVKDKDSARAYSEDRRLGVKYGFPTIYSMMNSHECFAELVSYYILDPQAKHYLSEEIQQELDKILNIR